jgi:hypothetical protein
MNPIDPVTLVVVQNGLQQVASEMDLTFERAAFSPVISQGFDRSDGIYDKDAGDVIAQGDLGLPRAMPPTVPSDAHRTPPSSIRELGSPRSWGWRPVPTADVRWLWASRGQVTGPHDRGQLLLHDGRDVEPLRIAVIHADHREGRVPLGQSARRVEVDQVDALVWPELPRSVTAISSSPGPAVQGGRRHTAIFSVVLHSSPRGGVGARAW